MKQHKKLVAILTLLCFALTFLPVAAFAAVPEGVNYQESAVFTDDENATAKVGKDVTVNFDFVDADGVTVDEVDGNVYVWFVKDGADVASTSVESTNAGDADDNGVFTISNPETGEDYDFQFNNSGIYTVKAAFANPSDLIKNGSKLTEAFDDVEYKLDTVAGHKTIEITSDNASKKYVLQLVDDAELGITIGKVTLENGTEIEGAMANDGFASIGVVGYASNNVNSYLTSNGVPTDDITFKLLDENGKAVKGAKVKLSTNNTHCVLSDDEVTTDSLGQFDFTIALTQESGHTDGFSIYIESGSFEAELKLLASSNKAYDFVYAQLPTAPISTDDVTAGSMLDDYIWIKVIDVNGNTVMPESMNEATDKFPEPAFEEGDDKYVTVVSKPAGSDLENEDVWLVPVGADAAFQNTLYVDEDLIAGDYTIKITMESGKSNTVSFTVAEMGTPVKINIVPKAPVMELGSVSTAAFYLVDANGVTAKALTKGTDVAVSGNGVREVNVRADSTNNDVQIYTKNDDKYAGSEIKIVAMNDRYNLSAEYTMYINDGSAFLMTPVTSGAVNTPVDLTYVLVTAKGQMNISTGIPADYVPFYEQLGLDPTGAYRVAGGQTSFAVLDKPEGATVNFGARAAGGAAASLASDTYAVARVECDTPGEVTLKFTMGVEILQEDGTWSPRIYTGTHKVNFTAGSTGNNVIMSIGSNEIVINDAKGTIDAAPIVENNRTFVPFRALTEAFGATVAYDEATQAVTAELNGTTVVMTIGSAEYTVNGEAKTADVAPFISGSRTMVPVRFVAEAFGIKVTPTYDENGATADILFAL